MDLGHRAPGWAGGGERGHPSQAGAQGLCLLVGMSPELAFLLRVQFHSFSFLRFLIRGHFLYNFVLVSAIQ